MKIKKAILLYARSRLNGYITLIYLAVFLVSLLAAAGALFLLLITCAYLAISGYVLFSRRGADAIVFEKNQDIDHETAAKLKDAEKTRKRISVLRVRDDEVRKALELFLLVSGDLIEASVRESKYLPQLKAELDDVLSACTFYMQGLDSVSTTRRYKSDTDVTKEEIKMKTIQLIRRSALQLKDLHQAELPDIDESRTPDVIDEVDGV
jgi:hypothetical protein